MTIEQIKALDITSIRKLYSQFLNYKFIKGELTKSNGEPISSSTKQTWDSDAYYLLGILTPSDFIDLITDDDYVTLATEYIREHMTNSAQNGYNESRANEYLKRITQLREFLFIY